MSPKTAVDNTFITMMTGNAIPAGFSELHAIKVDLSIGKDLVYGFSKGYFRKPVRRFTGFLLPLLRGSKPENPTNLFLGE